MPRCVLLAAGVALALCAAPLAAAAPDQGESCFRLSDIGGSKLADPSTLYVRVNGSRVFRIEFENPCPSASTYSLIMHPVNNDDMICRAIELNVSVRDTHESCPPKSLTELTPAQVAALPANVRP